MRSIHSPLLFLGAPTYPEIGTALGITHNAARLLVKALIKRGRATRAPRANR
jgi:hypothetical protein